ncbi:xylan glycosyltransferase MUCI21-like [Vicia villosa]|uniref:xylan glycosyltransferase MUCI21-like n=1 Tax=Vicia villosa TaxID=3911 RepID=UPI00273CA3FA|nr:xylan glycosyltransferase MUCI21-like [Vicia villosa]
MMENKTTILPKSVICFAVLGLMLIFQIIVLQDAIMLSISKQDLDREANNTALITCDRSNKLYDICSIKGPTLLDQTSLTLFMLGNHTRNQHHIHEKIQPYTLKNDKPSMSTVREFTLTSSPSKVSQCGVIHHSPAVIFNARGYNGNFFHEISDIFIPLYITVNSLSLDQDVILVIVDGMPWWFQKYVDLLSTFSPRHKIIDTNNLTTTHCFPSTVVGLIKHGPVTIDPKLLPYPKTLLDFKAFLKSAFIKSNTSLMYPNDKGRPHLTFVIRKGSFTRVILNQEEVIKLAEEIGFHVNVFDPLKDPSLSSAYRLIHSSHVLLGVHGAGLTHLFFLAQGSMVAQIVPIGLEWHSKTCFEKPTKILGLKYVEYKVKPNESSLSWEYGTNSSIVNDPPTFSEGNLNNEDLYLKKQNVKINLIRFRKYLTKIYEKAKILMNNAS